MTDLEITKLCAEAMGLDFHVADIDGGEIWVRCPPMKPPAMYSYRYNPLCNDAQAMELVRKFQLDISAPLNDGDRWDVSRGDDTRWSGYAAMSSNQDLNRAICECVAKMEQKKREAV